MDEEFEFDEENILFDSRLLLENFQRWQKEGRTCCKKRCFEHFRLTDAKKVWLICEQLRCFGSGATETKTGKAMWKVFISSIYVAAQYKDSGKSGKPLSTVHDFIIPYYNRSTCRTFFREMFCISHSALGVLTSRAKNTIVPAVHKLTGRTGEDSNRHDPVRTLQVVNYVKKMAHQHGMPWPVRVRLTKSVVNGGDFDSREDDYSTTEFIMPASFTKRELHRLYEKSLENFPDRAAVPWSIFLKILDSPDLSNIRINTSEKGVCGTCLSLCSSLRKQRADGDIVQRMGLLERVRVHLNLSTAARRMYKADCESARKGNCSVLSWDFATKVKIPTFQNETQSGFQAAIHGLDYNVFGIVNEGATTQMQTNLIFKEGRKVYADVVISLVHFYLTEINPTAGKAPLLILWMDSCSGQNRNQYLLQYLYTRILHGLNAEIQIKFMVRSYYLCIHYVAIIIIHKFVI